MSEQFNEPCGIHKDITSYIISNAPNNACFGCYIDAVKQQAGAEAEEKINKLVSVLAQLSRLHDDFLNDQSHTNLAAMTDAFDGLNLMLNKWRVRVN